MYLGYLLLTSLVFLYSCSSSSLAASFLLLLQSTMWPRLSVPIILFTLRLDSLHCSFSLSFYFSDLVSIAFFLVFFCVWLVRCQWRSNHSHSSVVFVQMQLCLVYVCVHLTCFKTVSITTGSVCSWFASAIAWNMFFISSMKALCAVGSHSFFISNRCYRGFPCLFFSNV